MVRSGKCVWVSATPVVIGIKEVSHTTDVYYAKVELLGLLAAILDFNVH